MGEVSELNLETINYRLTNIEKNLEDLKQLLITVPITQNAVKLLENRIEAAENNIDTLHHEFQKIKDEIQDIKCIPLHKSAQRWQYILDYFFKGIVAFVAVFLFGKFGFKK